MAFGLTVCLMAPACRTNRVAEAAVGESPASSAAASNTLRKLNEIVIPEMTFFAPATIVDAVDFLKQASREYDKSGAPPEKRGVSFDLHLPFAPQQGDGDVSDPFAVATDRVAPELSVISLRAVSLYDAIKTVCGVTGMKWLISGKGAVVVTPYWEDEVVTRSFNIPPALSDRLFGCLQSKAPVPDPNQVLREFFEEMGVTGPACARFLYLPVINKLRVTNTPQNLAAIEVVLDQFVQRMIEVEVQIHAFHARDIERLRLSGGVSVKTLTALLQKGKSRPVATATALTKSGQESTVKAVREVLYPTELSAGTEGNGSNVTVRTAAVALMPCNFEVRETGMILQVVPEVNPGSSLINLMLNPEWVTLAGWETYPASLSAGWMHKTLPFKQPVVGVTSIQTTVMMEDGETVLIGSCSTPDGEWVQVGFLTARLRDVQPASLSGGAVQAVRNQHVRCLDKAKTEKDAACSALKKKLCEIVIPEVTFRPPATIVDAVRFFKEASISCDKPDVPKGRRGVDFVLKLPTAAGEPAESNTNADPFAPASVLVAKDGAPVISALSARFINLYDALKLVCDVTGMKFLIKEGVVWVVPGAEPEEGMITRSYVLLPPIDACRADDPGKDEASDRRGKQERWKSFFAQLGVNWPCGSSFMYLSAFNRLRVTNTPENLEVFEQVLDDLGVRPSMVEVEMQILAFSPEDIERLRLAGDVSVESLMALRRKGKAKPVASATVVTKPGQEAVMKSVRELLYPTELDSDGGQVEPHGASEGGTCALMPSNFEMREVGVMLRALPEFVEKGSLIDLQLTPQWITLDRWESYPAAVAAGWTHKTLAFRQPVFGATSFQTQVTVADGGTVLLGNCSTPDGKWVHVGFLTAKRVDVQPGLSKRQP